ncbi:MAG: hypothetical protein ACRDHZ_10790 [Ktedonobacteraceae bacterium]
MLKTLEHAREWQHALVTWQAFKQEPLIDKAGAHDFENNYLAASLTEVARPLLALDQWDQAQPLLQQALAYASGISWQKNIVLRLQELGEIFAQQRAWDEVERILQIFPTLQDDWSDGKDPPLPWQYQAALVLVAYGHALAQAGASARAESVFEQAMTYTSVIDERYQEYEDAQYEIAESLLRAGQEERARLIVAEVCDPSLLIILLLMKGEIASS